CPADRSRQATARQTCPPAVPSHTSQPRWASPVPQHTSGSGAGAQRARADSSTAPAVPAPDCSRHRGSGLVHVDVKKLGRIPDGGGHKVLGRQAGRA
ncbi:hypothetical protein GT030_28440, partial [Streptomyces sp. SID1328]|nr:hypothetical protein [Streptomyces sp. SID1328]